MSPADNEEARAVPSAAEREGTAEARGGLSAVATDVLALGWLAFVLMAYALLALHPLGGDMRAELPELFQADRLAPWLLVIVMIAGIIRYCGLRRCDGEPQPSIQRPYEGRDNL